MFSKILLLFISAYFLHVGFSFAANMDAKVHDSSKESQTDSIMIENWSFMVLFESNRHTTDTFLDNEIEKLKSLLEQYPAFSVRLEARTDSVGSPQYNLALADRRLNSVRNELIKSGIEEDRFIEFVFGEEEPLADNTSPEGRQANRSVRVVAGLYSPVRIISGRFVSDEDGSGLEGILYTGSRHHNASFKIDSSGDFTFPVPVVDNTFFMEFYSKEDRILRRTFYNLDEKNHSFLTIPLKVIQVGDTFSFEDIVFGAGRATLLSQHNHGLNRLINLVGSLEDYRFEIQGHIAVSTKVRGRFKEDPLADARAKSVYSYLIENGIDSNRLEWRGYRNWHMVFPKTETRTQHRLNRRVSEKVLGRIDD